MRNKTPTPTPHKSDSIKMDMRACTMSLAVQGFIFPRSHTIKRGSAPKLEAKITAMSRPGQRKLKTEETKYTNNAPPRPNSWQAIKMTKDASVNTKNRPVGRTPEAAINSQQSALISAPVATLAEGDRGVSNTRRDLRPCIHSMSRHSTGRSKFHNRMSRPEKSGNKAIGSGSRKVRRRAVFARLTAVDYLR